MKHDRENTTAKAELVAKLGQMEGQTTCAEAGAGGFGSVHTPSP